MAVVPMNGRGPFRSGQCQVVKRQEECYDWYRLHTFLDSAAKGEVYVEYPCPEGSGGIHLSGTDRVARKFPGMIPEWLLGFSCPSLSLMRGDSFLLLLLSYDRFSCVTVLARLEHRVRPLSWPVILQAFAVRPEGVSARVTRSRHHLQFSAVDCSLVGKSV